MKAVHHHVAEKASEHLGNATVSAVVDSVASIHNKIKTHVNNVVDALKGSNSTAVGTISGAPRTSDPTSSFKMTTLGQAAGRAKGAGAPAASLGKPGSMYSGVSRGELDLAARNRGDASPGGWGTREMGASRGYVAMPSMGRSGSVETRRPMMSAAGN